jgi:hypothetical protein
MLGQHPQMYAVPELHLFVAQTIGDWLEFCAPATFQMNHGMLRAVGELFFGGQSELTVRQAAGWLARRSYFTTGFLLETLAKMTFPRLLVEGSPSIVSRLDYMQRAYFMFPEAHFLHLVWHPRVFAESVLQSIQEFSRSGPLPSSHWLIQLASIPEPADEQHPDQQPRAVLDPQGAWYSANKNICSFLAMVPKDHQLRISGEWLRTNPEAALRQVVTWLNLRGDEEAIQLMKHPHRSPYASLGPPNAQFGTDVFLPGTPSFFCKGEAVEQRLDEPLPWRQDGQSFSGEVKELARELGYK